MSVSVQAFRSAACLPALAEAWDRFVDERSPGAVFRSSAWLLPWWEHFGAGREICVLVAVRGDRPIGMLPAYRAPTAFGARLRLLGDGIVGSDYLGPIAAPEDEEEVADVMAAHLVEVEGDAWLERLDERDPLGAALARRASLADARFERRTAMPCPFIRLEGDYETWARALPRGAGAQLRRRRRWLEARPGFAVEVLARPEKIASGMETLLALHRARWTIDGGVGSDGIRGAAVENFHRASSRALAERGWARLYLLHVEGAPRAALYGFERGGRFAFYQSGHDPAWRPRSVGTVLLGAAIEDCWARGVGEFDLLHGDEAYKATYAREQRGLVGLRLAAGSRARLLHAAERASLAARRWGRSALPERAVAWARRRRGEAAR